MSDDAYWRLVKQGQHVTEGRIALIRFYQGKIGIYKIMVAEWEEELLRLDKKAEGAQFMDEGGE